MFRKTLRFGTFFTLFLLCIFNIKNVYGLSDYKKQSLLYQYYMRGIFNDRFGDIKGAIDAYKKAAQLDMQSTNIHFRLAIDYIKLGKVEDAIWELKLIKELDPDNVDARVLLSIIYSSQGNDEKAIEVYQEALETASRLEPENLSIYHSLGKLYFQQKKFDQAIDIYKIILQQTPEDSISHFFLGILYEEKNNRKLAIEELKKAIELDADFADALNSLGYIYAEQGINLKEAEEMIEKALEIQPDNPAYIDSLGWVYYKQGRIDESIKQLERAVSLFSDPVIHCHLGDAYYKNKNFEKAKQQWQKSIELDPGQEKLKDKLQDLETE